MKRLFLDTNILIDLLANRKPFSLQAAELFTYREKGTIKIYVSALSYNNIYYILRQSLTPGKVLALLSELQELSEVLAVTNEILKDSLKSKFNDFEDAIQYYCALKAGNINAIVTRNVKDYKNSEIPVLTPDEALVFIKTI